MMINININLASNTLLPVQSQGATNNMMGSKKLFRVVSVKKNKRRSIKMQLTMSIDWIDKLLAKHSAKNPLFRYSGTSQTFSDIFDQPFNQFLPRELVREGEVIIIFYFFFIFLTIRLITAFILHTLLLTFFVFVVYKFHRKSATRKGIFRDILISNTYQGHMWYGNTKYNNGSVICFLKPKKGMRDINGHKIIWMSIVSVHLHLDEVFCLHFDLRFKPGRQVTKEITIEDDSMYSFYSLILLYKSNKNKWYKQSKAVEINHARRLLTDLHFVRC